MSVNQTRPITFNDGYGTKLDGYTTNGSFFTQPIFIAWDDIGSIQVNCPATGSPNGSLQIQMSDTLELGARGLVQLNDDPNTWNWSNMPDPPGGALAISGATNKIFSFGGPGYMLSGRWLRLFYTRASGSITITIRGQLKG